MGSGPSGFTGVSAKTTEEAEALFKRAIQTADREQQDSEHKVRNIFISFHADDEAQVQLLRAQAKREGTNLEFRDYSIKEPIEQWRTEVREKIANTSATVVMIGPETANRPNVLYEIEQSYLQGKKVIGVRIYRDRNDPIPEPMLRNKAPIVNWDLKEIQAELDKS